MSNFLDLKRSKRIRRKLKKVNSDRLRLTVFRSSRNISAQIIDNKNNKTLISASSTSKKIVNKSKKDQSLYVAEISPTRKEVRLRKHPPEPGPSGSIDDLTVSKFLNEGEDIHLGPSGYKFNSFKTWFFVWLESKITSLEKFFEQYFFFR